MVSRPQPAGTALGLEGRSRKGPQRLGVIDVHSLCLRPPRPFAAAKAVCHRNFTPPLPLCVLFPWKPPTVSRRDLRTCCLLPLAAGLQTPTRWGCPGSGGPAPAAARPFLTPRLCGLPRRRVQEAAGDLPADTPGLLPGTAPGARAAAAAPVLPAGLPALDHEGVQRAGTDGKCRCASNTRRLQAWRWGTGGV